MEPAIPWGSVAASNDNTRRSFTVRGEGLALGRQPARPACRNPCSRAVPAQNPDSVLGERQVCQRAAFNGPCLAAGSRVSLGKGPAT